MTRQRERTATSGETCQSAANAPVGSQDYSSIKISSLGLAGDREVRRILRHALRDAWPAARKFQWRLHSLCELDPQDDDVGYTAEDGTLYVKVRDPLKGGRFYPYSYILATLLHELSHLSVLGHGKAFYRHLAEAANMCSAEPAVRREVHSHVCGELLNAVCENDAKRAKALLAVMPEAARCRPAGPGQQAPLEYAAHHGRVALTKLLLEARADPDTCCGADGMPPLARAAAQGNSKTMRVLLEAGAMKGRAGLHPAVAAITGKLPDGSPTRDVFAEDKILKARRASRRSLSLPSLPTAQGPGIGMQSSSGKGRRLVMLGGGGSLSL